MGGCISNSEQEKQKSKDKFGIGVISTLFRMLAFHVWIKSSCYLNLINLCPHLGTKRYTGFPPPLFSPEESLV